VFSLVSLTTLSVNTFMPSTPMLALFDGGVWEIIGNSSFFGIVIMVILLGFSVISWAVIVSRYRLFKAESDGAEALLTQFRRTKRLADAVGLAKQFQHTALGAQLSAGIRELVTIRERQAGDSGGSGAGMIREREIELLERRLDQVAGDEMQRLESGVILLATTANASPFLGLLGTVVGIMVAFWEIGQTGSASLAIVAPGIAEALLATIFGLGAAIPAVIAYNWANNRLRLFAEQIANFNSEFIGRIKVEFTE